MAKAIVLTSLTNFYYDDEGITEMISLNYASSIATLVSLETFYMNFLPISIFKSFLAIFIIRYVVDLFQINILLY